MIDIRSRPRRRRAGLGLAALLAGTASALHAQAPGATVTPAAATDSVRALSLDEALRLGLERSEVVRVAQAGVQRAQGQLMQARSQYFPQLTGNAGYQKTLQNQFDAINDRFGGQQGPRDFPVCADSMAAGGPITNPYTCPANDGGLGALGQVFASENAISLQVTGSQTLFAGGRVTGGFRAAGAARSAAEIGLAAQRAQQQFEIAQAYFDAQLADRLSVIADSTYVQAERTLRQTSLARQVGNLSEFELLRARVTRDNVRPQVIQARTARDVAMVRLRQLLDIPETQRVRLTTDIEAGVPTARPATLASDTAAPVRVRTATQARAMVDVDPAELLAEDSATLAIVDSLVATSDTSAAERSTVRQAAENVEAQRNLLRVARGQRLPAVSLSTNYQRFAYPINTLPDQFADFYPNWTVTLGVSVPLFTGGRIRGEEMVAQANLVEARESLQQAREIAAVDARLAVAELQQAQSAWQASLGTAEVAARAYSIADVRFREGISTQLELSESRVQLQQAQANRALAARNLQVARLRLSLLRDLPFQQPGASQAGGGAASPAASSAPGAAGAPQRPSTRSAAPAGALTQGNPGTFQ